MPHHTPCRFTCLPSRHGCSSYHGYPRFQPSYHGYPCFQPSYHGYPRFQSSYHGYPAVSPPITAIPAADPSPVMTISPDAPPAIISIVPDINLPGAPPIVNVPNPASLRRPKRRRNQSTAAMFLLSLFHHLCSSRVDLPQFLGLSL
ncbi:hypothetical protein BC829DRAFT_273955 [Chytridium lagenaria]|nr:hypothetical protein BC829DRAFT_273955 [Chytridium lagenaria]